MRQTALLLAVAVIALALGGSSLYLTLRSGSTGTSVTHSSNSQSVDNSTWDKFLGYIPAGYNIAPRPQGAAPWPCPSGMPSDACRVFQQTCGNGVCDPDESCSSCPIDCGVSGGQVCDPYTGRAGSPASVCQIQAIQPKG